ncbi:Uncharacterised protein [uncultured archaeon]|nr:Uncharacterised protein [uncultured archaeon]
MRLIESEKADAEVIGHVIVLGITITGIALILLVGVPSINHMQDMVNLKDAEQTFTVLDSRASKVALGESMQQLMNMNLAGGTVTVVPNSSSDPSYMLFEMKNATTTLIPINIPMGKIIYRLGEREVSYEGGGVWSKYPEGSVMLSPPEFSYNGVTITLPVLTISGNSSISGKGAASIRINKSTDPVTLYPDPSKPDYVNPISLDVSETKITIKSEYYDAWADYFRSITLAYVEEDPVNKTVFVTLGSPDVITNFEYAVLASDKIILDKNVVVDSYNSSQGNYIVSNSDNGSLRATNQIEFPTNGIAAIVKGNVMSGGTIGPSGGKGNITGDLYTSTRPIPSGITYGGNLSNAVSGLTLGNTANLVQGKLYEYKTNNNNSNSPCLTGTVLNTNNCKFYSNPDPELNNYYFTKFQTTNNQNLTFDTTLNDINIAIDSNPVIIYTQSTFTIIGNHSVRFYLNTDLELQNNIMINRENNNDTSSLFQIISSSTDPITFKDGSQVNYQFCGLIWAPGADISTGNHVQFYGAIVAKSLTVSNGPNMHFDEALTNIQTNIMSGTKLVYLYITRYDTEVSVS